VQVGDGDLFSVVEPLVWQQVLHHRMMAAVLLVVVELPVGILYHFLQPEVVRVPVAVVVQEQVPADHIHPVRHR
jgi:hypothetical protein